MIFPIHLDFEKIFIKAINMVHLLLITTSWLIQSIICFYYIRTLRHTWIRFIFTLIPCILLTLIGCHNLPKFQFLSIFTLTFYWLATIRLIHLTVLAPQTYATFHSFIFKILWFLFPIVSSDSIENQWTIFADIVSATLKLIVNHWLYAWLLGCTPNISYGRIALSYFALLTTSYIIDMETALMRFITRDKYTLQSYANFPLFSQSLRDFWGRRFNRFVGIIFKESLFHPLHSYMSSREIKALITFIISGLLHVHIVFAVFNDNSSALSTFMFFFINGIACCVEAYIGIQLAQPFASLMTHIFLLLTVPMCIGPFIQDSAFLTASRPLFYGSAWIPKLPVPKICPK